MFIKNFTVSLDDFCKKTIHYQNEVVRNCEKNTNKKWKTFIQAYKFIKEHLEQNHLKEKQECLEQIYLKEEQERLEKIRLEKEQEYIEQIRIKKEKYFEQIRIKEEEERLEQIRIKEEERL